VTPVVCLTPVERRDSSHIPDFGRNRSYARFRSKDVTPVVCPTLVKRHDSSRIPDFGQTTRLRSYAQLKSKDATLVLCLTLIMYLTPVVHQGSGRRLYRMSYLLICERLCMVELDDFNILQYEPLFDTLSKVKCWMDKDFACFMS
jgi:hypothetical protein